MRVTSSPHSDCVFVFCVFIIATGNRGEQSQMEGENGRSMAFAPFAPFPRKKKTGVVRHTPRHPCSRILFFYLPLHKAQGFGNGFPLQLRPVSIDPVLIHIQQMPKRVPVF